MKTPLYGHTSQATAYVVADYPYGRVARCRIRYWIESHAKFGFRFVSQTERPDGAKWNAPKKSTYCPFAAAMYLDENGHVKWTGLGPYSSADEALTFARDFPGADMTELKPWAAAKAAYAKACSEGKCVITINGEPRPWTEADNARHRAELATWLEVAAAVGATA